MTATSFFLDCDVSLTLSRDQTEPSHFVFDVTCAAASSPETGGERLVVGRLTGFTYFPGRLTRKSDIAGLFDLCDARASYLLDGYTLLGERPAAVARAATQGASASLEGLWGVIFCERMEVHPSVRGNRLGLRLLPEASHMFSLSGALMLLKAWPDETIRGRELSDYLCSDDGLGLGSVQSPAFAGWLAGICRPERAEDSASSSVTLTVGGLPGSLAVLR